MTPSPPDRPQPPDGPAASSAAEATTYGGAFWFAYLANTSLMMVVSLLFRYGDFVALLGGGELALGLIVGVGTVGSLVMRLAQGVGIDRYGARLVWLVSLLTVALTLLAHMAIERVDGPAIYLVRIAYHTGVAGAFGASMTYISLRAPVLRMAEMIGILGTSGFVGMAIGTQLGDLLCRAETIDREHIDRLFFAGAALAFLSLASAWMATRGATRPIVRRRPPMLWLIRRYQPGPLLLMAVVMGFSLGLPGTFLRPYTETLGIAQIGTFFGAYAGTAFVVRLLTRQLTDRLGVRPAVLMGMTAMGLSMLLQLSIVSTWQLAIPGVAAGVAHALLFPAVVAGGSRTFPARYRGLGVTLMLGMFDVGNLVGMPLAGLIVEGSARVGLLPYPTMFLSAAGAIVVTSVYYAITSRSDNSRSNGGRLLRSRPPARIPAASAQD